MESQMTAPRDDADLFDTLYEEDALYDEDKQLAARDLPPRAWRVSQRAVDEIVDFARMQLDLSWRLLRERARRARFERALQGAEGRGEALDERWPDHA
jgi:hypothetical protein